MNPVRFAIAVTLAALSAFAQSTNRQTVMVAMRDGVKLSTDIYLPPGAGPFPTLLGRTPYGKQTSAGAGESGAKRGYTVIVQDTRGRFASEGDNLPFDADGWAGSWDGYDTVAWSRDQKWCNGKIGTFGGSAGAITQLLLAGSGQTNVLSQHLTVGTPSLYREGIYAGGIFRKALVEDWLRVSKFSPEALKLWTSHPNLDAYWSNRELNERYHLVNAAAVHIGGYFDIFAQGTIDSFLGYQKAGGPNARGRQKLIMGPWTHAVMTDKSGELLFPNAKRPPGQARDQWHWFDYTLKGVENGLATEPAVTYYVMGDVSDTNAPGNVWRTADHWPPEPVIPTKFYLHANLTVSTNPPSGTNTLSYPYDPKNPVPTVGGPQLTLPAGPRDQRSIESRADVLVFTSEPLAEPVEITGPVGAVLWVASDGADTDFFARLCDVYPDGRSINICEGGLRARFRASFGEERFLAPGEMARLQLNLWTTSIIVNRGHRLRVHVTSSSAPAYDPNPNTGDAFRANDRTRLATNTIHCSSLHPSHLVLPVAVAR